MMSDTLLICLLLIFVGGLSVILIMVAQQRGLLGGLGDQKSARTEPQSPASTALWNEAWLQREFGTRCSCGAFPRECSLRSEAQEYVQRKHQDLLPSLLSATITLENSPRLLWLHQIIGRHTSRTSPNRLSSVPTGSTTTTILNEHGDTITMRMDSLGSIELRERTQNG